MKRYAKVIVVSDGLNRVVRERTKFPHHLQPGVTAASLVKLWELIVHLDTTVDGGMEFDTLIICNGPWAYQWWKKYDKTKTMNGQFVVIERENEGGSFAGYNYAYRHTDYHGFIFTEEDILVSSFTKPGYFKLIHDRFHEEEGFGFVYLVGKSLGRLYPIHCHGGVGYTERQILDKVVDAQGNLAHHTGGWDQRAAIREGEVPFTNNILSAGFILAPLDQRVDDWSYENLFYPFALFSPELYAELGIKWYDV